MNKIKEWAFNFLLKKYALGWLVAGWKKASGWRTVIAGVLAVMVFIGQALGYVPEALAEELYKVISSIAAVSFLEKLRKYEKQAAAAAEMVKAEAAKAPEAPTTEPK